MAENEWCCVVPSVQSEKATHKLQHTQPEQPVHAKGFRPHHRRWRSAALPTSAGLPCDTDGHCSDAATPKRETWSDGPDHVPFSVTPRGRCSHGPARGVSDGSAGGPPAIGRIAQIVWMPTYWQRADGLTRGGDVGPQINLPKGTRPKWDAPFFVGG